ncbi:serine-threonine protein kinase-like protein [Leishmania infantum JPCM5]|uniref:Serine-threonine protein kinase-like protein n=2 Tax=Leishmania infantum TaxID=5671 RepID=A4HS61_LEIIN|nr:serine-threonine protein kinase-like protein [Leishmania infantum JPCM5]CAM65089.1 serine-threonine protein kinase-like protein [Leishmania infantum JPCM5]|eukprot:XP_001462903.1 serine-threonine protein kinase-like protein [Leishmania infantum JPCM5]
MTRTPSSLAPLPLSSFKQLSMNAPVQERSGTSSSNAPPAHKKQRHEGGCSGKVLDDRDADSVRVWGVLVAQNLPSRENGLLAHAPRCRCPVEGADAPGKESVTKLIASSSLREPEEDWLWRHVPPALRQFYFPVCSHSGSTYPCAPASAECSEKCWAASLQQEGDKSHPSPSPRLLLPLCGTRSNNGAVRLGRLASNGIVFATNPCVSNVHCTIAYQPGSDPRRGDAAAAATVAAEDKEAQRAAYEAAGAVAKVVAPLHRSPQPATDAPAAPHPRGDATGRNAARIMLSDYSTNGCIVNGQKVGKGRSARLRDGDVVELINAGPRRTTDYNLSFLFLTAEAFVRWVAEQPHQASTTQGADEDIALAEKEQQQRQALQTAARRRALLCRAQWNVEAQVRRMYGHSVDEYYSLDRAHPLGQGTFGTVYRAALRAEASASSQSPSLLDAGGGVAAGVPSSWEYVFSGDGVGEWTANPAEAAELREAYIRGKERRAPASVLHVSASAASTTAAEADAITTDDAAPQVFAVKIIRKQRMLFEALQQQQQQQHVEEGEGGTDRAPVSCIRNAATVATPGTAGAVPGTISAADAAVIEQLLLMETQPDDLAAQRRKEWTAGVLASLQLADLTPAALTPSSSLSAFRKSQHKPRDDDDSSDDGDAQPLSQQDREQRRRELIRCLPEALRRTYERELQHRRRQQREINILLAVRHRNVTALYEVFDQPDHLALVMEQATGGEVWDLLQIYKRRERGGKTGARKSERGANNHRNAGAQRLGDGKSNSTTAAATAATCDDDDDVELVSVGGPLPEFIVKIIIVQVIEAVLYLHTMGIIHRDLKLENLMLQRPCDRYALNALQLQTLVHQLRAYSHSHHASDASTSAATTCEEDSEAVEFTNPLSVLYTVHVPRHMWPVVKIMDFGLSHVLDHLQTHPFDSAGALHGFAGTLSQMSQGVEGRSAAAASAATEAVPERVKLIYSRNDATTSCGTPIYAAPEVTNPALRPDKMGYGAAVDMYSVGVIAYALLTGRAPFPSAKNPRRPGGPPVVNYDAPLRFQRHRRRPAVPKGATGPPASAGPLPSSRPSSSAARPPSEVACLPPLSVVESVRVVLPKERAETSAAFSAASEQTRQWHRRAEAVAASVRCAEQKRALAEGSDGGSSATPADTLFATTVEQLCASLTAYADMCASGGLEVDLDRLVYVSADAAATGVQANASVGRVMAPDGHVADVLLPPISALGTSFLRGLLEKYPSRRLTAYEALRHPWLRECV